MIFVTVGAQMPFDRLVLAVDAWAERRGRDDVFAQIGPGGAAPRRLTWTRFLEPEDFKKRLADADVVVSHAGMGTILSCLETGKPIVVMPRLGALHETRNDHQVATAQRFRAMGRVHVADDAAHVADLLDHVETIRASEVISARASPQLLRVLHEFVETGGPSVRDGGRA